MRLLSYVAATAILGLTAGSAWAQATPQTITPETPAQALPGGATGGQAAKDAAEVDLADPFGDIDVAAAGATTESMTSWMATLNDQQKAELKNACEAIEMRKAEFQADAQSFCERWAQFDAANAPAGGAAPAAGAPAGGAAPR